MTLLEKHMTTLAHSLAVATLLVSAAATAQLASDQPSSAAVRTATATTSAATPDGLVSAQPVSSSAAPAAKTVAVPGARLPADLASSRPTATAKTDGTAPAAPVKAATQP